MTMNASFIYSLKAPLNQWLKLQSTAISGCLQAVLAKRISESRYQLLAQWPLVNAELDDAIGSAITEGIAKARLHLVQIDSATLIICQPVLVDGVFWGSAVFKIACADKKLMPSIMKKLQGGLTWLQLILQSYAAAPAQVQSFNPSSNQPTISTPPQQTVVSQDAQLLQLFKQLTQEKSLRESAITLVNLLATHLQAVRVSVGLLQQQAVELEAISFSANFDKRTQPMQLIARAMDEAVEQNKDIRHCSASPDKGATTISRCHQQIADENKLALVTTYLLRSDFSQHDKKIIGAITIEYDDAKKLSSLQEQFIAQVTAIAAQVMQLKISAEFGVLQRAKSQGTHWLNSR
ncbi:MAG: hypothetical protein EOO68_26425, partial [Moraxellaceae bacterium]